MLYVVDLYSKYAWVFTLKIKKSTAVTNTFQKALNGFYCKPSKIWIDKGSEFYNRLMKSWLQDNDTEMYSIHIKENMLLLKDLLETYKIYKYVTSLSKMYISIN